MIFVLTIINNVNNICKNENHWSLLISVTHDSLLGIQTPQNVHSFDFQFEA